MKDLKGIFLELVIHFSLVCLLRAPLAALGALSISSVKTTSAPSTKITWMYTLYMFKFKCRLKINWKEEQNERSVCLAGLISRPLSRDVFDDHFSSDQPRNSSCHFGWSSIFLELVCQCLLNCDLA